MDALSGAPIGIAGLVFFEVHVPPGGPPEPGRERFVPEIPTTLGGAINTASVVQALGRPAQLYCPNSNELLAAAIRLGIKNAGLANTTWPTTYPPALSLVYPAQDDRSFVSEAHYESLGDCPAFAEHPWIHVAGLAEAHTLRNQLSVARRRGAKVSVSGSWNPTHLDALSTLRDQPWDLIVLNRDEAQRVAGDLDSVFGRLEGAAKDAIVTAGARGAIARIDGQRVDVRSDPVEVVDATGAGDAFVGGYLVAHCQGREPTECLRIASRVASRQLAVRGGVLHNRAGLEAVGRDL